MTFLRMHKQNSDASFGQTANGGAFRGGAM
jgi:hypothetical protein